MPPVRWGGGEATVGAAGQPPATFVDSPVVDPAQQGQVGQVGGAAVEPVAQVVGFAPGQGAVTVGEDTAAVADGQGVALGGLDDPAGPADLQRLGGGTPEGRRQQSHRGSQPRPQPRPLAVVVPDRLLVAAGVVDNRSLLGAGVVAGVVSLAAVNRSGIPGGSDS
jgi:hypothetical protein